MKLLKKLKTFLYCRESDGGMYGFLLILLMGFLSVLSAGLGYYYDPKMDYIISLQLINIVMWSSFLLFICLLLLCFINDDSK